MTAVDIEYGIDRTRQSPCCGVPILLEHRSVPVWGGRAQLGTVERCSECEGRI